MIKMDFAPAEIAIFPSVSAPRILDTKPKIIPATPRTTGHIKKDMTESAIPIYP
ncbi:MAG: hypothetical protein IJJ10_15770 [Bacillus sp. (in: Bacteria)]|nr:hypothetical protein [Bacillus sp. (in: firmicutes)]